jgi:preprotein translocase subunit SecG
MIYGILIALQMIISVLLVVSILLQSSKGSGLAGIAGGMMSSTVFGGRSAANFLQKAAMVLAGAFMLNCLGMAVISTGNTTGKASVTQQSVSQEKSPVPSTGGAEGQAGGDNAAPAQSQPAGGGN